MNFIIFFAFCVASLTLLKDCLKGYKSNKLDVQFDILFVTLSVIPLIFNVIFFFRRNCNLKVKFLANLTKFIMMDSFDEYFYSCIEKGCWFLCGGEFDEAYPYCGPFYVFTRQIHGLIPDNPFIEVGCNLEFNLDNFRIMSIKKNFSPNNHMVASSLLLMLERIEGQTLNQFCTENGPNIWFNQIVSNCSNLELIDAEFRFSADHNNLTFEINNNIYNICIRGFEDVIFNDLMINGFVELYYEFRLGEFKIKLSEDSLNVKFLRSKTNGYKFKHGLSLSNIKKLYCLLIDSESQGLDSIKLTNGLLSFRRKEFFIFHLENLKSICQELARSNIVIRRCNFSRGFEGLCIFEGTSLVVNLKDENINNTPNDDPIGKHLKTELNKLLFYTKGFSGLSARYGFRLSEFLINYIKLFFGFENYLALNFLINRSSCWRYRDIGSNWKSKRFLCDVNYIFENAGVPQLTHKDKSILPSKLIKSKLSEIPKCDVLVEREMIRYDPTIELSKINEIKKSEISKKEKKIVNQLEFKISEHSGIKSNDKMKLKNSGEKGYCCGSIIKNFLESKKVVVNNREVLENLSTKSEPYKPLSFNYRNAILKEFQNTESYENEKKIKLRESFNTIVLQQLKRNNLKQVKCVRSEVKSILDENSDELRKKRKFLVGSVNNKHIKLEDDVLLLKNRFEVLTNYIDEVENTPISFDAEPIRQFVYENTNYNLGFGRNYFYLKHLHFKHWNKQFNFKTKIFGLSEKLLRFKILSDIDFSKSNLHISKCSSRKKMLRFSSERKAAKRLLYNLKRRLMIEKKRKRIEETPINKEPVCKKQKLNGFNVFLFKTRVKYMRNLRTKISEEKIKKRKEMELKRIEEKQSNTEDFIKIEMEKLKKVRNLKILPEHKPHAYCGNLYLKPYDSMTREEKVCSLKVNYKITEVDEFVPGTVKLGHIMFSGGAIYDLKKLIKLKSYVLLDQKTEEFRNKIFKIEYNT